MPFPSFFVFLSFLSFKRSSTIRCSAAASAATLTLASHFFFTRRIDTSTISRIIESTSRPTYPTSVNLVASTFTKGASTSFASLLAISVLPTPVGPIIIMFLGTISSRISSGSRLRLYLLRSAIATVFFASSWPTMYLLSASTVCFGVSIIILPQRLCLYS